MKRITAKMLVEKDACSEQVKTFRKLFPHGASVTLVNVQKAQKAWLDIEWAANRLLSAPARKAYDEATALAWKAYGEATAPTRKAYREAIAPADKAYHEAIAPAWKAYGEAIAPAFVDAWKMQEEK